MRSLGDLPLSLRAYLLAVIAAGTAVPLLLALGGRDRVGAGDVARAALLVALAAIAERLTLHLTHKTAVSVATAADVAALLVLPVPLPGLVALLGGAVGQLSRRRGDPIEAAFNAGQAGLTLATAALTFAATSDLPLGRSVAGLGSALGVTLAAGVYLAANTLMVAVAAGLHLGTNPLRVWRVSLGDDLPAQAVMAALGVAAASLLVHQPWFLPVLALPLVLVHRAIRDTVRLRADTHEALAALVEVVELRDPYTAGHSRRVAALARALALRLGLTHEEADLIESAGRVHDLGKVAIDPGVLTKPGKLDEAEWAEMKRHPVLGADVVARFAAYRSGVPLVRHHHEAWGGGGYPDGLAGEAIPLGARILAVADTFDALTSARPYRAAMGVERARAILKEGAGTQWDARVVDALIAHLDAADESAGVGAAVVPSTAPA